MISVLSVVLFVLGTYKLTKKLFNDRTSLIAAALAAFFYFDIKYSQEARAYSLIAALSVFSYYYFLKFVESKEKFSKPYFFIAVALEYLHLYGMILIFVQACYYFLTQKNPKHLNERKNVIKTFALIFLSFLPWMPVLAFQAIRVQSGFAFWIVKPTLTTVYKNLLIYSGSVYSPITKYGAIFFILLILVTIVLALIKSKKADTESPIFLLLFWFAIPILLIFLLSQIMHSLYDLKSTIIFVPAFLILIAYSVSQMKSGILRYGLIILIIAFNIYNYRYLWYTLDETKEQWRESVTFLNNNINIATDYLIIDPGYYERVVLKYYLHNNGIRVIGYNSEAQKNETLDSIYSFKGCKRFWVISAVQHNYLAIETLKKNSTFHMDSSIYKGVRLYLFSPIDSSKN